MTEDEDDEFAILWFAAILAVLMIAAVVWLKA